MNIVEACCLLHVSPTEGPDEITKAFRQAASIWHPDRGGDHEAMQFLNEARAYLLSKTPAARGREWTQLQPQMTDIMTKIIAKMTVWAARKAAAAAAKTPPPEPIPTHKTTKRRAGPWEARNADKVRLQTTARVKTHRSKNPEEYRLYMREYMKQRRAKS